MIHRPGAEFLGNGKCSFTVWAPLAEKVQLHLLTSREKIVDLQIQREGYHNIILENINPGTEYFFRLDGEADLPDPASVAQSFGVHGPSIVVDHGNYQWKQTGWKGKPINELVIYELHTGTFTHEGTFQAIIPRLDELVDLGISAIELMPVSQFPGRRNWGYDGVYPYSVHDSYGGVDGLKELIDACHAAGIAVILDVVYNHLGPEGNYLERYGPYFTDAYKVPWGKALNFDGEWCDGVREYFSRNALYWFREFKIDGLRIDAIHTIYDNGAIHFWEFLHNRLKLLEQELGRKYFLIAESDYNSPRVVKVPEAGGFGFDAQWLDDFHHALYVILDPAGKKYYEDFGKMEQLAKAITDGFVHSGEFVQFRKRRHGASSAGIAGNRFVVFCQNHDIVGNRVHGERLSVIIDYERLKLAAGVVILSPYIPMLFMGEEYAEDSPFQYFVDHSDEELIKQVREGRRKEFEGFHFEGEFPDPNDEKVFLNSKLGWGKRYEGQHAGMLQWYKSLLGLRRSSGVFKNFNKAHSRVNIVSEKCMVLHRQNDEETEGLLACFNFGEKIFEYTMPETGNGWLPLLNSTDFAQQATNESESQNGVLIGGGQTIKMPPASLLIYTTLTHLTSSFLSGKRGKY